MNVNLQDFMSFLHDNKLIDLDNLLRNNGIGCINRLKLQKYVYLAQTYLDNEFGMSIICIIMVLILQNLLIIIMKKLMLTRCL